MLKLSEILKITSGIPSSIDNLNTTISAFSIDTRTLQSGNIFVALQGATAHGNDFISDAIARKASAIITDKPINTNFPCILVSDSLHALSQIAAHQRLHFQGQVCAITGTSGKTSVKEALSFICTQLGLNVHKSEKSYNNHIGVPLTIANLPSNADVAFIEIGMNHPGEILPLTVLSNPHIAVITTIGPGHLGAFNSVKEIALEKVSIVAGLVKNGVAILPRDSEFFDVIHDISTQQYKRDVITFGNSSKADIQATAVDIIDANKVHISARIMNTLISYHLPTAHAGWVQNSLSILAAINILELDIIAAAEQFHKLPFIDGRGRTHLLTLNDKRVTVIDDAYNANPLSMSAALNTLTHYPGSRKIAVIGDMRELGNFSEAYHTEIGQLCRQLGIEKVLTCGTLMQYAFEQLLPSQRLAHVLEYNDVFQVLSETLQDGDVVLLKASNGVKLYHVASDLLAASQN